MLFIHAAAVEDVLRLKREIDARLRRIGRMADVVPWLPNPEVRERLGLRSLPAVFWIRRWPDDLEIYCQGCAPNDDVLERCAEHSPKEFAWRAWIETTRRALDEKRRNAPKTLDDAAQRLLCELSDGDKRILRETPERDLGRFHFG